MNEKIIKQIDTPLGPVQFGYRYYTPTSGVYFVRIPLDTPVTPGQQDETTIPAPPPQE